MEWLPEWDGEREMKDDASFRSEKILNVFEVKQKRFLLSNSSHLLPFISHKWHMNY